MDDALRQAYARLNVHELLLEILFSQYWAQGSTEEDRGAAKTILNMIRNVRIPSDAHIEESFDDLQIMKDAKVIAERLLRKIEMRAESIRKQQANLEIRGGA